MDPLENNSPVILTILSEPAITFSARVLDLAGKAAVLSTSRPVSAGQPVQIEASNSLWLGEVRDCRAAGEEFELRVDLIHALEDLAEFARLSERFTGRSVAERSAISVPVLTS